MMNKKEANMNDIDLVSYKETMERYIDDFNSLSASEISIGDIQSLIDLHLTCLDECKETFINAGQEEKDIKAIIKSLTNIRSYLTDNDKKYRISQVNSYSKKIIRMIDDI